jgi:2'-5' RNA ligase
VKALLRTFVGIRCGRKARARLHAAARELARGERALRVPALEDLHLTLQFLGDTRQEDLAPVGRALVGAARGVPPLEVVYEGLGAFPAPGRPRVVWAGVREEGEGGVLERLARQVGEALGPLGFPPEARRFHAHVTLARVRGRPSARVLEALAAEALRPTELAADFLSELELMLSDPGSRPYHYIDLTTVPLGATSVEGSGPASP